MAHYRDGDGRPTGLLDALHSPFCVSCASGDEVGVRSFLDQGISVNKEDHNRCSPLICAIFNGHLAIVQLLVMRGANMDENDLTGHTPLMCAIYRRHLAIVRLLIESGANIDNANNRRDFTPLIETCIEGDLETTRMNAQMVQRSSLPFKMVM